MTSYHATALVSHLLDAVANRASDSSHQDVMNEVLTIEAEAAQREALPLASSIPLKDWEPPKTSTPLPEWTWPPNWNDDPQVRYHA